MPEKNARTKAFAALTDWYESNRKKNGGDPDRYVVCAGLVVLELMRDSFPLDRADYITDKNQMKTGGSRIKNILARHGENREYVKEGARTTRGTIPAANAFVDRMNQIDEIVRLSNVARVELVELLQGWLVDRARDYFNRQRIEVEISLEKPGPQIVGDIIAMAKERDQAGPVAQHLVGAKLAIRYPLLEVDNHSFTTADVQTRRSGDFKVNDTIFHVTVAPMPPVIEKCGANLKRGFRAILLVPEVQVPAALGMAENLGLRGRIGIQSIEAFVGQNVEELSEFGKANLSVEFRRLLETYNDRVSKIEIDRSLLIEIPENL